MGSAASCGAEPWPPRPMIRTSAVSAAASMGPVRQPMMPAGASGRTWSAKAASGSPYPSSNPSSSMILAPPQPSSPG